MHAFRVLSISVAIALTLAVPAAAQRMSQELVDQVRDVEVQKQLVASGVLDATAGLASRRELRKAVDWFRKAYKLAGSADPLPKLTAKETDKLKENYDKFVARTGLKVVPYKDAASKVELQLLLPVALVGHEPKKMETTVGRGRNAVKTMWWEYRSADDLVAIGPESHALSEFTPIVLFRERIMSAAPKYKHLHLTSEEFTSQGFVSGEKDTGYFSHNLVLTSKDRLKGIFMRYDKKPSAGFEVPDFLVPVLESDPDYEGQSRPDPAVRGWELLLQSAANLAASDFPFRNDWQRASSKPCSVGKKGESGQEEIRILFGTDRKMKSASSPGAAIDLASLFGNEAGNRLHLGCAYVAARGAKQDAGQTRDLRELYEFKDHRVFHSTPEGDVGDRLYLTDEIGRPRDEKGADKVDLGDDVQGRRGKSRSGNRTAALVFIHGYNVAFTDALLTAAHIASTTDYKGRVYMYSWPSAQSTVRYIQDLDNAEQAEPYLQSFMKLLMRDADIDEIDIVVHSMGSQPVLRALSALRSLFETEREERDRSKRIRIGQIIFAAPDVAVPVFDKKIQRIAPHADRVTVYVSSTDAALFASTFLRGGASRMGEIDTKTKEPAFIDLDNVHLIDATGKESWHGVFWRGYGHDYLTQAKDVLEDIKDILKSERDQETTHPDKRALGRFKKEFFAAKQERPFWKLNQK